ncbi:hypothetical protein ACFXI6_14360 [Streptomyces mirabilis]|uniref:hypothetical protein n=1 Tax=Streptomyces mirabilis TaxID=68239 RepID=UPI003691FD87
MGWFSNKSKPSGGDSNITTAEDLPRFAAQDAEARRRGAEWDAMALEYRAKCPQNDHTRCLSH